MYHNNCLDGIAAAWVIRSIFPNALFVPMSYGINDPVEELEKISPSWKEDNLRLMVVDYSFPRDTMVFLSRHTELAVIDHHKSAMEECDGLAFCTFDMDESGATLAYKQFYPDRDVPLVLKYVRDGDLWLFDMPGAHEVRAYMQSFPHSVEQIEKFAIQFEQDMDMPVLQGGAILRFKQTLVGIMTRYICIAQIGGFDVPVVNASCLASEVTEKLCKDWPQYPFVASYYDNTSKALRLWRLTSIGEFDVSVIAAIYGGGGHRNAAGFEQALNVQQMEQ